MRTEKIPQACFAPPLSDAALDNYELLIDQLDPGPAKDAARELLACARAWWELPESTRTPTAQMRVIHKGKEHVLDVVPFEPEHVRALYDVTPWDYQLNAMSNATATGPLDALPPGDTRNAVFHLLWFANEITRDREPITNDRLGEPAPLTFHR